jgi:LemA protein
VSKTWKVIVLIVVGLALLGCCLVSSVIGAYNNLATGRVQIEKQQGNIEADLQRQADLIPNFVSAVKGQLGHEDKAIQMVTDARKAYVGAQTASDKLVAGSQMEGALARLLVVMENYPQLVSQQAIKDLMVELEGSQNRITFQRIKYNEDVFSYNKLVVTFPSSIIAGMFGFTKYDAFKAQPGTENPPTVNLNQ